MPVVGSTAYMSGRTVTSLVRSLLNDAAYLLSVPVNIASITRNTATGMVTVTCQLPHNFVVNDNSLISGVPTGTSNFNGTFPVTTVITPYQFTYTQAGVNDTQASGQVQGYGIGAKYTDSVLMPYVNSAQEMVGNELENIASQTFIVDNVLLVVPAVSTVDPGTQVNISDATAPPNQLPTNLLYAMKLWERPNGSTDDFFEMVNLTDSGGIPPETQGETLEVWEQRTDGLWFRGATQDTQIRLRYMSFMGDLLDGTSQILVRNVRNAIAYFAAAAAGLSRGSPLAEKYEAAGQTALEQLVSRNVRELQHKNYRMRPFGRRQGFTPF